MKNLWISFSCAIFFTITFLAFFKGTKLSAQERGPASASGLKSSVPLSREMEIALERKKANIENQERELKLQQQRLQEESIELTKKIEKLEFLLKEKEQFEKKQSQLKQEQFQKLVKTYEKMPPKKASEVISAMDDQVALDILQSLKDKPLAAILSAMSPDRATVLTSKLAARVPASDDKLKDQSRE